MSQVELGLYDNAMDSIRHAVEHYVDDANEARRYKFAVLHLSHGVLLLLKERLSREHPSFIYANVAKPEKTVDVDVALSRLKEVAGLDLSPWEDVVRELAAIRNHIEHFAMSMPKQQADSIICRTIPFLVEFTRGLGKSFQMEIGKGNWNQLLKIQAYLSGAIARAKETICAENLDSFFCPRCQDETAVEEPRPDPVDEGLSLRYGSISCLVCLQTVGFKLNCRGCGTELILGVRHLPQHNSYCGRCAQLARAKYGGFENPMFVSEVERWLAQHETVTGSQLFRLLSNVATLVSSAPRYVVELIEKGVIEFANDHARDRYLALRGLPYYRASSAGFEMDDTFHWAGSGRQVQGVQAD